MPENEEPPAKLVGYFFLVCPKFADRAVCIAKDLGETLETLRKACKNA